MSMSRHILAHLRSTYLPGTRVKLERCNDKFTKLEPGLLGTVQMLDDVGTVHIKWDNGSYLGLCLDDGDRFTVMS